MNVSIVNLTVSTQESHTLLALTDKLWQGYGVRNQMAHDSRGSVVMATGTSYSLQKRLCQHKSIHRKR